MFAHFMQNSGFSLDFAIDINPVKQGCFMPGTALEVLSPKDGINKMKEKDNIFILNRAYLSEIIEMTKNLYNYILVGV